MLMLLPSGNTGPCILCVARTSRDGCSRNKPALALLPTEWTDEVSFEATVLVAKWLNINALVFKNDF